MTSCVVFSIPIFFFFFFFKFCLFLNELGANVLVKYIGEEGEHCPLSAAVSVANPFDLLECRRYYFGGRTTVSNELFVLENFHTAVFNHSVFFQIRHFDRSLLHGLVYDKAMASNLKKFLHKVCYALILYTAHVDKIKV